VVHQRRPDHPDPDGEDARVDVEAGLLAGEDAGLSRRAALPSVLLGPGDAGPPGVVQRALPLLALTDVLGVGLRTRVAGEVEARPVVGVAGSAPGVGFEPGSGLSAEGRFGGRLVDAQVPAGGAIDFSSR
jgi:hypothetical protein